MIKKCIICNKEYEIYDSNKAGNIKGRTKNKKKRGRNTITCSKKCSWIHCTPNQKKRKEMKELHKKRENELELLKKLDK